MHRVVKKEQRNTQVNRLTVQQIKHAQPGAYLDGRGLVLTVTRAADGQSLHKTWTLRYYSPVHVDARGGKLRREMGLGRVGATLRLETATATAEDRAQALARAILGEGIAALSLAEVRALAETYRAQVRAGIDPIDERDRLRDDRRAAGRASAAERAKEHATLRRVIRAHHEKWIEPKISSKDSAAWIATMERHIPAQLLDAPVARLEIGAVKDAILALRQTLPETSRRVRQRLGQVLAHAKADGLVATNVMLDAAPLLRESKAAVAKTTRHYKSLPYKKMPAFIRALRAAPGIAARALEFTILTAGRTGETLGATWDEIDLDAALWTIPGTRMKGGEEHRVPLSARAVEVLKAARVVGAKHIFTNPNDSTQPLSDMALLECIKRLPGYKGKVTTHGNRSSFSTWANEERVAKPDCVEAALAHREGDRIRAAYYHDRDLGAERRALLEAWATYLATEPGQVVALPVNERRAARQKHQRASAG
jgi:integrase